MRMANVAAALLQAAVDAHARALSHTPRCWPHAAVCACKKGRVTSGACRLGHSTGACAQLQAHACAPWSPWCGPGAFFKRGPGPRGAYKAGLASDGSFAHPGSVEIIEIVDRPTVTPRQSRRDRLMSV